MKLLFVLSFVCVALVALSEASEEGKKSFEAFAKNCQAQEKATDADLNAAINHEPPTTETGNCLRACILESAGMLQEGKLNLEAINAVIGKSLEDKPESVKISAEVSAECVPLSEDANRCTVASKFIQCSVEGVQKRGFNPKDLYGH